MAKEAVERTIGTTAFVHLKLGDVDLGKSEVATFEWKSFLNGGYEIICKILDPGHRVLNAVGVKKENWWREKYLRLARKDPFEIQFKIGYPGGKEYETCEGNFKKAIMTELISYGDPSEGHIEIVAIDPPSWFLTAGKSDGKVFTGSVSEVIQKVVEESSGGKIKSQVSKTKDPGGKSGGKWPQMRQDPHTFIVSLLDWSSKILKNQENSWMVGVSDDTIYIQDQKDYLARCKHLANYSASITLERRNDIVDYAVQNSTLLTPHQTKLTTQGISAVSGKFIDKQVKDLEKKVVIEDKNTTQKLNAKTDKSMAFAKSQRDYSTSIVAVPEFSGGELGIKYEDWIGGRPQQQYLTMLPMIMRCNFTVFGDHRYYANNNLGVSTIKVTWKDLGTDGMARDYYLHGHWIVYGFVHRFNRDATPTWLTDVYAYRIEQDAKAQTLP